MTCSVKNAEHFIGHVRFRKRAWFVKDFHLNQRTENRCHSTVSYIICGRGTNDRFSYEKLYVLKFKSLSHRDIGKWVCAVDFSVVKSNTYYLKVESEFLYIFINTSSVCFMIFSSFLSFFLSSYLLPMDLSPHLVNTQFYGSVSVCI